MPEITPQKKLNKDSQLRVLLFGLTSIGLLMYNWWIFVPLKSDLIRSPNELFSNLEITGKPYASLMQHADLLSGLIITLVFVILGKPKIFKIAKEWYGLIIYGLVAAIGGIFSETCADEINAVCRNVEWKFQLPVHHYLHMGAGIIEFAAITYVLYLAYKRTRGLKNYNAKLYRILWRSALVAYPLLGIAYIFDILGAYMEIVFFIGFSIIVWLHLLEWLPKKNE